MTDASMMPPECPLEWRIQDLGAPYLDSKAPGIRRGSFVGIWRLAIFVPAVVSTLGLIAAFTDWFRPGGLSVPEAVLIGLIALTFFWIALSVSTVTVGIINRLRSRKANPGPEPSPMHVALLIPVYNERPSDVFGNAAAMLQELRASASAHRFSLFILSDTRDPQIANQEVRALEQLNARLPAEAQIYYRRRDMNTDRKVGNLSDWIGRWGGAYEAMLVLDADSLMAGDAIIDLTDEIAHDPSAGLIQSFPQLFGAQSLFGRVQQFSSAVYGSLLAEGLAKWSDREGNYWGHNAIIRTAAFASCAGLPKLTTRRDKDALILSHDFVEAGLLRRAGWAVRFLPRIKGSYEESPATLVDYVLRDRRWCQGNLQHLRILNSSGFHAVSRFHLFQGAMSYLLSPAWFVLLMFWALLGNGQQGNVITYFNPDNPLMPIWPEMATAGNILILLFMYGMLLAPKVMGALSIWVTGVSPKDLGGIPQFLLSFVTEVVLSIAFAPILMVQQSIAVLRTVVGYREVWSPQQRDAGQYPLKVLAKFHWVETLAGTLLMLGMSQGLISLWLLPITLSLLLAIPLSALSGVNLKSWVWTSWQMGTPEEFDEPNIIRSARLHRMWLRAVIEGSLADSIPAE